jgi:PAS domain-containing protein
MSQKEIEVILARSMAEHLTVPIFIVDPAGNLLFYNAPAGDILGVNFDETGPMPASKWATMFQPLDPDGSPLPPEALPLIIATNEHRAAHKSFCIRGMDGAMRMLEVTGFPLVGQAQRYVGAMAIFWEVPQ